MNLTVSRSPLGIGQRRFGGLKLIVERLTEVELMLVDGDGVDSHP